MTNTVEVIVGRIGKPHGVRGDLTVEPRTDEPERRFQPGAELRSEDGRTTLTVQSFRWHSGRLLVRFEESPDRDCAESLRGTVLVMDVAADEQPAEADEFWDRDLVGLTVLDAAGNKAGTVLRVTHSAQDLLEIRTPRGVRLVPFVEALVPSIDLATGTLQLADVAGLLEDLEDAE